MSPTTPAYRLVHQHQQNRRNHFSNPIPVNVPPMAIPGAQDVIPPPLPPPTNPLELLGGHTTGWQWGTDSNESQFGKPAVVKPGSSLLGGASRPSSVGKEQAMNYGTSPEGSRRGSSISTVTPHQDGAAQEDASTQDGSDRRRSKLAAKYGWQNQDAPSLVGRLVDQSSQSYDRQMLSRMDGPNAPKRLSVSQGSGSLPDNAPLSPVDVGRQGTSLHRLSVPEIRSSCSDSPSNSRWPPSGAISPGRSSLWSEYGPSESTRPQAARLSSHQEDQHPHRDSYDHAMFINDDFGMEDKRMSNLNLHDRSPGSPKAGSKRRASSPPREREDRSSVSSASGQSELYQKRSLQQQLPLRDSPVSRYHPNHSSLSSASSYGLRHGSFESSLGIVSAASSVTSYGSGRASPIALSPATLDPELRAGTPYSGAKALVPSPMMTQHPMRNFGEHTQSAAHQNSSASANASTNISASHSRNSSLSHAQAGFVCECCPKKPKRFNTDDELKLHESEKQYACAWCKNRFKNKNEAERHQNSLHLRRHSWSCSALAGPQAAFTPSSSGSGSDVCGYCGEEFSNPPQWDARAEHLQTVHKFTECNSTKKFYRADHFRQHLRHSHAGTSGKWTNHLEGACLKEEEPPEKRPNSLSVSVSSGLATGYPAMLPTAGLSHPSGHSGPSTIPETPHDC